MQLQTILTVLILLIVSMITLPTLLYLVYMHIKTSTYIDKGNYQGNNGESDKTQEELNTDEDE